MNNRAYKIVMMSKHEIKIDADELPKVLKAIANNSPVILKQGILNPNSYSHIIEDTKREYTEKETNESGHYTGGIIIHSEKLADIFAGVEALAKLKGEEIKKLL